MISWFARNGVAANLLMFFIIVWGGFSMLNRLPLEVFPSFELDRINIRVPFRGATPAEVEESINIRIEEAIHDLEGIKELRSTATEGIGTIIAEVAKGYDSRELMDNIKLRVDGLSTLPDDSERPVIYIPQREREVISVVIAGDLRERELRQLGERVRDDLNNIPEISRVKLDGVRDYELAIEVSENTLRQYGLTLDIISNAVRRGSLDLAAGSIKTQGGEVLIRTKGQAYSKNDFSAIVILTRQDGTRLTVGDIATVKDGFEEEPVQARCNNQSCVMVDVFRVGNQNAISIAQAVKDYIENTRSQLPPGVTLSFWRDRSKIVKARLTTLINSAIQGGALILLLLTLFLRFSVALWVFVGVPVSFMGGLAIMPELGVTINIVSLFAFILVLGIVVDDAIVTGENIYTHLKKTNDPTQAAIQGTHEVAVPVTFGVLTTVAAFLPLLMVEGIRGKIFASIPLIVIPVLLFSLIESKLILPAHLKHLKVHKDQAKKHNILVRIQRRIADGLERLIITVYQPILAAALRQRYFTLSLFVGVAIIIFSLVSSGHLRFIFFPRVQSEVARASLVMPAGTPFEVTSRYIEQMTVLAQQLQDKYIDPVTGDSVIESILSTTGSNGQGNTGRVMFEITPPEHRTLAVTSSQLVKEWRRAIGTIPGAKELNFRAEIGRGGSPLDIQLTGQDFSTMRTLADEIKIKLAEYPGVFDITDNFDDGKQEIQLNIKPTAELLGLNLTTLAQQVRQAFFGLEVQRIQRGRDDVRVMVRYPLEERRSLQNLENMKIRTPDGVEIPFSEVAEATTGRSFSAIKRVNRNRTVKYNG